MDVLIQALLQAVIFPPNGVETDHLDCKNHRISLMRPVLVTALVGFFAGAIATFWAVEGGWLAVQRRSTVPGIIGDVPQISLAEAESHRNSHFIAIRSIGDVMALPGDFARTEAIYALAGRSDSASVQNLIFQANGIVDASDRKQSLLVLFARLTELDAASALALSRTVEFGADRDFESTVWRNWSRLDLAAAMRAANNLESAPRRHLAAQSMFAAHGFWGNGTTERISKSLGIRPDDRTRSRYLAQLADRDPAAAIDYINRISSAQRQREAASSLGYHLGYYDYGGATRYTAFFHDEWLRQAYTDAIARSAAQVDPNATLDALLTANASLQQASRYITAFQSLAERDIDAALVYLERVDNSQVRQLLGPIVSRQLALIDPARALAWAKENGRSSNQSLYIQALSAIAGIDPELAIAATKELSSPHHRQQAFNVLAMTMTRHDPQRALALLDHIDQPKQRAAVAQSIASMWMRLDFDAAISWVLQWDASVRHKMLARAARQIAQMNLASAIRWLPRLDDKSATAWRAAIASNLATQRSIEEARSFIAQYEGSDDYPRLLSSVISGLAKTDARAAIRMARRLPAGDARNGLLSKLIMQYAHEDPQHAANLVASIADDTRRAGATSWVVAQWSRLDPAAAERWTRSLPRGEQRANAIVALAGEWDGITPARQRLIDTIGNTDKRIQAMSGMILRIARSDPEKAERLLRSIDLSAATKTDLQAFIESVRDRQPY